MSDTRTARERFVEAIRSIWQRDYDVGLEDQVKAACDAFADAECNAHELDMPHEVCRAALRREVFGG